MVRFHWHVEGGLSAFIAGPQTVVSAEGQEKVYEMPCYIELAGQKETFEGLINVRSNYFEEQRIQPVGVALAHDTDVATARGKLIAKLALELAGEGFVVMRCLFNTAAKDVRRFRLYEKSLDALATSPYARTVDRWLLAGLGNGARVAAVVAGRCRGHVAGCCLLSYPLLEAPQPTKSSKAAKLGQVPAVRPQDSAGPLLKLQCPCIFVTGERDLLCPAEKLTATQQEMSGTCQNIQIQAADQHFKTEQETEESDAVVEQLCSAMLSFLRDLVKLGPAPVTLPPEGIAAAGQGMETAAEAPIAEASKAAAPAHAALAEQSSERQEMSAGAGDANERVPEQREYTADPAAEQAVQLSAADAHVQTLAAEAAPFENAQILEAHVPNGPGQGAAEQPQDGIVAMEAQAPNGFAQEILEQPPDESVPMEA